MELNQKNLQLVQLQMLVLAHRQVNYLNNEVVAIPNFIYLTYFYISDLACYPAHSEKMASINRAVLLFIVRGMHPLSMVDNSHFINLVKVLDPRIELPCRSTLTKVLLTDMYEEAKRNLQSEIDSVHHVALTTDGWTSITGDSYVIVTIHFINNHLKMLS